MRHCPAECFGCRPRFRTAWRGFRQCQEHPTQLTWVRTGCQHLDGMYDLKRGCLEGLEDPGGIFKTKQNMISLLSALSLLRIQGCQGAIESSVEICFWHSVFFTVVLGLAIYLAFWFANGFHGVDGPQVEPDAELETANTIGADHPPNHQRAAVELTPYGYVAWLIERCERCYLHTESAERRALYSERVTMLHGLQSALTSVLRPAALRSLVGMSDINDDESSLPESRSNQCPYFTCSSFSCRALHSIYAACWKFKVSAQTLTWCTVH